MAEGEDWTPVEEFQIHLDSPGTLVHRLAAVAGSHQLGFRSLPSVTLLDVSKCSLQRQLELRPGEIMPLRMLGANDRHLSFSAVCRTTLPAWDTFAERLRINEWRVTIRRVHSGTDTLMAVLPWDQDSVLPDGNRLLALKGQAKTLMATMRLRNELPGEHCSYECGCPAWFPPPGFEGLLQAHLHARSTLDAFLFKLSVGSNADEVRLRIELDEGLVRNFASVLGSELTPGMMVVPKALPLMNVELVAWQPGQKLREQYRNVPGGQLGLAGLQPWIASRSDVESEPGMIVGCLWQSEGSDMEYRFVQDDVQERIHLWWTSGGALNGTHVEAGANQAAMAGVKSGRVKTILQGIEGSRTAIPCMGGTDFGSREKEDYGFGFGYVSGGVFRFRATLRAAVRELLRQIGYDRVDVSVPRVEIRRFAGKRQSVVVVEIDDRKSPMSESTWDMLRDWVVASSDLGRQIVFERLQ